MEMVSKGTGWRLDLPLTGGTAGHSYNEASWRRPSWSTHTHAPCLFPCLGRVRGLPLGKLAVLVRSKYLVKCSVRFGVGRGQLRCEIADVPAVGRLPAVSFFSTAASNCHGRSVSVQHRLFRAMASVKIVVGLLLLCRRQRQMPGQEANPVLDALRRVRWILWLRVTRATRQRQNASTFIRLVFILFVFYRPWL